MTPPVVARWAEATPVNPGTAINIPAPSGRRPGDLLLAHLYVYSLTAEASVPGWEMAATGGIYTFQIWTYWRVADGTSADDFEATWDVSQYGHAALMHITGADPHQPLHVIGRVESDWGDTPTAPGVTTTVDDTLLVWVAAPDDWTGFTVPDGWTGWGAGDGAISAAVAHATAGPTGDVAGRWSSMRDWVAYLIAVAPAVPEPGPLGRVLFDASVESRLTIPPWGTVWNLSVDDDAIVVTDRRYGDAAWGTRFGPRTLVWLEMADDLTSGEVKLWVDSAISVWWEFDGWVNLIDAERDVEVDGAWPGDIGGGLRQGDRLALVVEHDEAQVWLSRAGRGWEPILAGTVPEATDGACGLALGIDARVSRFGGGALPELGPLRRYGVSAGTIGQTSSVTVSPPSGTRAGDLLVVSVYAETSRISAPAGWAQLVAPTDDGEGDYQSIWVTVADGAGSHTFTPSTTTWCDWVCVGLRGFDTSRPINAAGIQANTTPSRSMTAPSITTTVDGCLLLMLGAIAGPADVTPPSGMVEVSDDPPCWAADAPQERAGATGPRVASLSDEWRSTAALIAVAPAVSGGIIDGEATISATGTLSAHGTGLVGGGAAFASSAAMTAHGTALVGGDVTFASSAAVIANGTTSRDDDPVPALPMPVVHDVAALLRRSHRAVFRAQVINYRSPGGADEIELPAIVDGTVTLDANAAVRGRCDVTIADSTGRYVPRHPDDLLAPYGNELRLWRGVQFPDGHEEYAPLGVYRIETAYAEDAGGSFHIQISGLDRSQRVIEGRFETPYQIPAGTNVGTAIRNVILPLFPEMPDGRRLPTDFARTTSTTANLIAEEGSDRWEFAQKLAVSVGMELFFDGLGALVLRPITLSNPSVPDWEVTEGENGVLVRAARSWTREGAYNAVIATGENISEDAPPVRGVARDTNPRSPTYYYGPFGQVPRFYASEFLTTEQQCIDAASAMLARELGTTQKVDFGTVVNPWLTPGSVVLIKRERLGIDEYNIIDTLTIPLSASGEMSGSTRASLVN